MKRCSLFILFISVWLAAPSSAPAACISDTDNDGVCDNVDACPNTIPGATVDSSGCPPFVPGDYDQDGDVDADDLGFLTPCRSAPTVPASGFCQAPEFDFDSDRDVDMDDFSVFQRCFSGANNPADPGCERPRAFIQGTTLYVNGTSKTDVLVLRLQSGAPGVLNIDVGDDGIVDFSFLRTSFDHIVVSAFGANDVIAIDEINGVFTDTEITAMNGGYGHDTMIGGSGGENYNGGPGNDSAFLGGGNDQFFWNSSDETDFIEGEAGVDNVIVNGGDALENFTITANGLRVRFDRLSPAPFNLDIGTCENLLLNANGGNDTLACTGNLAALILITADGGPGEDLLLGSNGPDLLIGGDDNDFIDGQQGGDVAVLGAGDDIFQWDPGDGSDTVEGQTGHDIIQFNGSGGSEIFTFSPNGSRLRFNRNLGNVELDINKVEQFDLQALAGTDTVTVNNLTGAGLTQANLNLAGTLGGNTGDAAADTVILNASNDAETMDVVGSGSSVSVTGLPAQININQSEGANDSLVINANGGDDAVTATTLPAAVIKLTLDGGNDDDTLLGSQGADVFLGGDGDDSIFGDNGNDLALMGADADVFQWNPGDGSDTVEGQDGADTLLFFGSDAAENIDIVANGGRVLCLRDVGSVTMDLNDVESIDFRALGGADDIVIGDLTGTDMLDISLDLRGSGGGGDGAADTITVNGTNAPDVFGPSGNAAGITVFGLQAEVNILFQEVANDHLTLNALAEDDVVDAASLQADGIPLTINGGLGEDVLLGGAGNDLFNGGDGDDLVLMGAGDDTFVWNPGDDSDTLEGQADIDTMLFNGANVAEQISISPNGGRILFFRDVASVLMDLNDLERIEFTARGGADTITINNLSGTDATEIDVNLESVPGSGAGDGQADNVIVTGTNLDDVILADGNPGGTTVNGLSAGVSITGGEAASDRVTINALAGHDVVDGTGLEALAIPLTANGGGGDDILLGGDGNDTLLGGDQDDVLLGGPGLDVLDGGLGENVVIQGGAISASAIATIMDDNAANDITISRDAGGQILSNGVPVPGATIANTELIRVFGQGGDDNITVDESNGALPPVALYGGAGNDTLAGGSGTDQLFGGVNEDTLLGGGEIDFLFGGNGNDTLTGGDGGDLDFGEAGNDQLVWNPGHDTDLNEGGSGTDTVVVNGGNGDEDFTVTANGTRVRFDRINPAPFSLDIGTCENLVLNANGGNDSASCTGNLAALIQITLDGGPGDDTLLGSNGADVLMGGDNNDFVDGQQGNDDVFLGAGNDTFQWDPGDGSDLVEGEAGLDVMVFNGSGGSELFAFSANGSRLQFTRNLGNIVMDVDGIEQVDLKALGGVDGITVNSLAGTAVAQINVDLASILGGNTGDAAADSITVNGTSGADVIHVAAVAGTVSVTGLSATVNIKNPEVANDALIVNGLGGFDGLTQGPGVGALIMLTLNQ